MIRSVSRTLTIAIFPFLIYVFQLVGKASTTASEIAGVLLLLKIIVELWLHRQQFSWEPPLCPPSSRRRARQKTIAGCYFCEQVQVLRPYHFAGMHVGVCARCEHSLRSSRRRR